MNKHNETNQPPVATANCLQLPPLIPGKAARADIDASRATFHRIIKRGDLEAVHIYGKLFITRASYDTFMQRALRGELACPSVKTRAAKATAARKEQEGAR